MNTAKNGYSQIKEILTALLIGSPTLFQTVGDCLYHTLLSNGTAYGWDRDGFLICDSPFGDEEISPDNTRAYLDRKISGDRFDARALSLRHEFEFTALHIAEIVEPDNWVLDFKAIDFESVLEYSDDRDTLPINTFPENAAPEWLKTIERFLTHLKYETIKRRRRFDSDHLFNLTQSLHERYARVRSLAERREILPTEQKMKEFSDSIFKEMFGDDWATKKAKRPNEYRSETPDPYYIEIGRSRFIGNFHAQRDAEDYAEANIGSLAGDGAHKREIFVRLARKKELGTFKQIN
jgi:hypothetical protein